jgi:uncharacterized protein YlxP (DUF503 family)
MPGMVIGALRLKLVVFGSLSLKDKRRAIKSLKERLANRFNVSVAEVGYLDDRQQAELGVAMVANDPAFVTSVLDKMVDYVRQDASASLIDYEVELL